MSAASLSPRARTSQVAFLASCLLLGLLQGCGPAPAAAPGSSDGLAFLVRTDAGGADIVLATLADGSSRALTDTPESIERNLVWIPSLQHLSFTAPMSEAAGGKMRMMLLDPRNGALATITDRASDEERDASLSPDGKRMVYVFDAPPGSLPERGVKAVRLSTGVDQPVLRSPEHGVLRHPRLSSGGEILAELWRKERATDIVARTPAGGASPLLVGPRFSDSRPRFSRSGELVYFERSSFEPIARIKLRERKGLPAPLGGGDVCVIALAGGPIRCLGPSRGAREHDVEPSPTRDEVAFVRVTAEAAEVVLRADPVSQVPDGPADADSEDAGPAGADSEAAAEERVLIRLPGQQAGSLVWSPDGERLAFVSGSLAEPRVRVVDRTGQELFEAAGYGPAWMPPLAPSAANPAS
jgi:dipeptidyl aminopeptidase/acylaminoacyl peptidase